VWTRNGYDWSSRYPRIVEAARRHRPDSFVLDGEAVLLGVDGIADFNGLHSRKHDDEVQLYAFDVLMSAGVMMSGRCRCTCGRTISLRCCGGVWTASS
jgi:bifunctional non-homologous end joining protein LigD